MREARRRSAGVEEVRRRLARELHDDHGQRAVAIGLELRALRNGVADDDPRKARLDALGQALGELANDLRRLSHDLHPAVLEHRGLAQALVDHCTELQGQQGLCVELDLQGNLSAMPQEVALGLYRIAQEALANVVRHGRAKKVKLGLHADQRTVELSLVDDGVGFDVAVARRSGGLGLASMEERARLLSSRCRIVSAPGVGTTVEVRVPRRRLSRWVRRRWECLASVGLIVLTLSGGMVATMNQARQTAEQVRNTKAVALFLEGLFTASDPHQSHGEIPDARQLLRRGTERLGRELIDQPLLRAHLLDTLGGIHTELGLYDEARPLLEEALALRRELRGADHPEVLETLVRLGSLAHLSGRGDAVELFQQACALQTSMFGGESPELADLLNKLGVALGAKGRFDEGEEVLRRSLELYEQLFGVRDPQVAKVLHNLAGVAFYRDQQEVSEELLQRALAIRQGTLAEDHLDLADSREALAVLRLRQGRSAEAAELLERLAATMERVYGPDHPRLARTILNLGLARARLGENDTAGRLFERALAINEKALAAEHPDLVRSIATLAAHHLELGRHDEAEPLFRRLLALHERGVAYDGWDVVLAHWRQLIQARGR